MSNRTQQNALQVEKENALREQQVINCRILGLKHAMKIAGMNSQPGNPPASADAVIAEAKKITEYLISDINALKPKSSLVITGAMPPPAAGFKPGD